MGGFVVANLRPSGSGLLVPVLWARLFVVIIVVVVVVVVVAECHVDQAFDQTLHFLRSTKREIGIESE